MGQRKAKEKQRAEEGERGQGGAKAEGDGAKMEQKEAKEERGDTGREEGGGEGREREPHLPAGLPDPRHPPPQTSSRSVHTMRPGALWDCALCRHHCSLQFLRQWAGRGSFPMKPQQCPQRAGRGSFPNSAHSGQDGAPSPSSPNRGHSGQDGAPSPTVPTAGRMGLFPQQCTEQAGRGSSPNCAHSVH